jgi:hypothetical protein
MLSKKGRFTEAVGPMHHHPLLCHACYDSLRQCLHQGYIFAWDGSVSHP